MKIMTQIEQITELIEQLKQADKRELELLAVIDGLKESIKYFIDTAYAKDMDAYDEVMGALQNSNEPSQALREHEATVLEEAATKLDSINLDGACILEHMAEERRKG